MAETVLKMTDIDKRFPGVHALKKAHLTVERGEVRGLVGENGAGKSTLIKILAGVESKDSGTVEFEGKILNNPSPKDISDLGITFIYQDQYFVPYFDIAQTLWLGSEPCSNFLGQINKRKMYQTCTKLLKETIDFEIDPKTLIKDLGVSERQMIEIARALRSKKVSLVVFDEPTAPLTEHEIQILFNTVKKLKEQKIAVIYISHRLEEIFQICDKVTILRDGENVGDLEVSSITPKEIVKLMVGKTLAEKYAKRKIDRGKTILHVRNLRNKSMASAISLDLHRGEILGLFGLVGAGKTELAEALFGVDHLEGGETIIDERLVDIRSPKQAIANGLAFLPEDRRTKGLILDMTLGENVTLANLKKFCRLGLISGRREKASASSMITALRIKASGPNQLTNLLSGGNQQKTIVARWLVSEAQVFIFDQPTAGIDVGAKREIYGLMENLSQEGAGIILISSELPEILGLSDRILVMYRGRIVAQLDPQKTDQHEILLFAMGGGAYEKSN
jgi:ribose transport system ATP-binding protein